MSEKNDGEGIDGAKKPKKPRKAPAKKPAKTPAEILRLRRDVYGSLTNPWDDEPAIDPGSIDSAPNTVTDTSLTPTDTQDSDSELTPQKSKFPSTAQLLTRSTDSLEADTTNQERSTLEPASSQVRSTPPATSCASENEAGDVPIPAAVTELVDGCTLNGCTLLARARDGETRKQCWERLRQEARTAGMTRRDSVAWAGRMVEQVWFPPPAPEPEIPGIIEEPADDVCTIVHIEAEQPGESTAQVPSPAPVDNGVSGLGDLPEAWPTLPANAQLQTEIAWVSANRLRVRSGNGVDLSRALSPAPSYSALSWLETSILFPAKFADISVKATAGQEDERESVRREKLAIEEIRSLLAEMLE